MPDSNIRPATAADATGIARVHIDSWRTTYQGIIAAQTLAGLAIERRQLMWQELTSKPAPGTCLLVAERGGDIVGFASAGPARGQDDPALGEVYAVYLLKEAQGLGLGHALMKDACSHLLAGGRTAMMLWVLKDNLPARGFYEKLGGRCGREQIIEIAEQPLIEVAYEWDDIRVLIKESS